MGLTEGQQDAIVLEHGLMLAQQRDIIARSRGICARTEALQPAAPAADSNTHGVRLLWSTFDPAKHAALQHHSALSPHAAGT